MLHNLIMAPKLPQNTAHCLPDVSFWRFDAIFWTEIRMSQWRHNQNLRRQNKVLWRVERFHHRRRSTSERLSNKCQNWRPFGFDHRQVWPMGYLRVIISRLNEISYPQGIFILNRTKCASGSRVAELVICLHVNDEYYFFWTLFWIPILVTL